ncbi:hypothetical protein A2866_03850 [Candidatus Roizmanbacteria bacterium RIFCSPHIGHO2_01_FULL_39_8]|uniref:FCP1 homology domain-containing protein n=3 Tax=Candidatus Roizmaniibacteriota TaxID=1752723 RepID=A0A1F7GRP6_9BACT|nr:MAG: hypothetical protein A2866_03850 [Candidatus Roizmanbacteria bacterium RIFCSPHIGHO2_01_FULL_39_8]OGK26875.1 MAG: hypothetical protein A3C28_03235 [Candidatus Roizmanbacteria bacterium RIFCSPHIGHO2_02_FULL_39_9]OGK35671.1 MAG: hypothetical protein A3F60_01190 [Candidatus Roizmanbacteria bacterium RIFCSPHIGHO2_12_FULL_39_8]
MNNKIILFDIDRTILDTDKVMKIFTEKMLFILGNPNISDFMKVREEYLKQLAYDREFVPEDYIKAISRKFQFSYEQSLIDVFFDSDSQNIYKESVYPEVRDVFKTLTYRKYRLGIFSEGEKKFQNHKFRSLHLGEYLDDDLIFIFNAKNNSEALKRIPRSSIIVDDKLRICEFLDKAGIKTIWINKKGLPDSTNFQTIHYLSELNKVL